VNGKSELTTEAQRHRANRSRILEEKDPLTEVVIGAAIEVHRIMGPGLLESVSQRCMEEELRLRNCPVDPQARIPLRYKGDALGDDLVMDLYFPDRLVVELKAVDKLVPVNEAQLLTYLKPARRAWDF
jgi:GxxExxY protein